MEIKYKLTGIGWASGHIEDDNQKVSFEVSYMRDALGNLTDSIIYLIENFGQEMELHNLDDNSTTREKDNKQNVIWEGEPWGYTWDLNLNDNLNLDYSFKSYKDIQDRETIIEQESINRTLRLDLFVKAVTEMLEVLLREYGFLGYKSLWHTHEFPIGNYLRLKNFLDDHEFENMEISENEIDEEDLERLLAEFETKNDFKKEVEKLKHTAYKDK